MIKERFIDLFAQSFKSNWDLPALTDYGQDNTLTYAELAKRVARMHILLEQAGIKKHDKVALVGLNNTNWCITYIATVTYGAVIVPILQDFHPDNIENITEHSESRILFASDKIWNNLKIANMPNLEAAFSLTDFHPVYIKEQDGKPVIDKIGLLADKIDELFNAKYPDGYRPEDIHYADNTNEDIASINYTSGTTGSSKGVLTPGNALAGNITFGFTTHLLPRGATTVSFLPLAHAYGCAFDFLTGICAGVHVFLMGRTPSPTLLFKAFKECRPHSIFVVPLLIEKAYKLMILPQISKAPVKYLIKIPGLKQIVYKQIRDKLVAAFGGNFVEVIIGGAPLNAEVEDFLKKIKFPFSVGYGMTECAPLISKTPVDQYVQSSVGQILPIMDVKIMPVPGVEEPGVGEILVKGENVMAGYYKNEEATKATFTEDGWLKTGDLGKLDEKRNIFIKGRNKTMLLGPNGQNIYPEEIEAKLNNMDYVAESLVIQKEQKLIALVNLDSTRIEREKLTEEQIAQKLEEVRAKLNKQIAAYEQVTKIVVLEKEFEKTPKKSIKRYLYTNFEVK